jgi:hypothetical protein
VTYYSLQILDYPEAPSDDHLPGEFKPGDLVQDL